MDAHRSRSLGMAALIFILISLTAAVFHGAAPVRAEDVTTPTPIVIDENTANVTVELYKDSSRTELLGDSAVTSVSTLYGTFSANFLTGEAPTSGNYVAVYKFPDTIDVDNNDGGVFRDGPGAEAEKPVYGRLKTIRLSLRLTRAGLNGILRTFMSRQTSRSSLKTRMSVLVARHP